MLIKLWYDYDDANDSTCVHEDELPSRVSAISWYTHVTILVGNEVPHTHL